MWGVLAISQIHCSQLLILASANALRSTHLSRVSPIQRVSQRSRALLLQNMNASFDTTVPAVLSSRFLYSICKALRRRFLYWLLLVVSLDRAAGISRPARGLRSRTRFLNAIGLMVLLSDGTVLAQNEDGSAWTRLTPDAQGDYLNGTWTPITPMHDTRLYCATQILKDGRLFMAGGEYGTGHTTSEVYDPLADAWTETPSANATFSDANSEILPDGRVLVALVQGNLRGTIIYDPKK